MDKQEIFEELKEIIMEKLSLNEDEVSMTSNIVEDLSADSLDLVEIALEIERIYDIDIPEEMMTAFETVADVVEYIVEHTM